MTIRFGRSWYAALLVAALIIAGQQPASAIDPRRWEENEGAANGMPVRQGHHIEWQRTAARNAAGQVLVVWSDTRNGNRDLWGQLVSANGTQMWAAEGIALAAFDYRQEDPEIVPTNDGWIIAWIDFRSDTTGDVWAIKVNNSGAPVWSQNNFQGVVVDSLYESVVLETTVRAVHDGQNGAIIAWEDDRRDGGDIFAQHIDANGNRTWSQPLAVTNIQEPQFGITADSDGQGNMLLAWNDKRESQDQNIYAAKITPDGQLPWGKNGRIVCAAVENQRAVKLCPDGVGGCYIGWVDPRNSTFAPVTDLYVQRINGAGVPQWATDGIPLCTDTLDQEGIRVAVSINNGTPDGCVAVWEDLRVNNQTKEVFGQKISLTGSMLWGNGGMLISGGAGIDTSGLPTGAARVAPRLTTDNAGGLICGWDDYRNSITGGDYDFYTQRVLANGTFGWNSSGNLVMDGQDNQGEPVMRLDEGDGVVAFYSDQRNGSRALYYRTLNITDGSPQQQDVSTTFIYFGLDGHAENPQTIEMGLGQVGIVWEDNRFGSRGAGLMYQIVDSTGAFMMPVNGDTLIRNNSGRYEIWQKNHRLCPDGMGGFYVVWEDQRTGGLRIRVSHVNHDGSRSSDEGVEVWNGASISDQSAPFCAPDGTGGCYVAFSNSATNFEMDVYVQRVNASLQPQWAQPVQLSFAVEQDDQLRGLVSNPDGCAIAVWRTGRQPQYDIVSAKICPDGAISWNLPVCNATNIQENPNLVADGQGGAFYAWDDKRVSASSYDIYAQHVLSDGTDAWQDNGIAVVIDTLQQLRPKLAMDSQQNLYVVWEDFRNGNDLDLYGQKISAAGAHLWATPRMFSSGRGSQQEVALFMGWDDDLWAAWSDARGAYPDLYGTHLLSNGNEADGWWEPGVGGVMCDFFHWQTTPSMTTDCAGGVIAAWVDKRASGKDPLNNIWAGRFDDQIIRVDEIPAAVPTKPELGQCYPNPFNPSTRFEFSVPGTQRVQIEVFNTLGQQVEVLVDKVMTAGRYQVSFKADRLASGMYFYRMKTPGFVKVKKMTLVR